MARILIAYFSQTGNTEKVARAIREKVAASGYEADLRSVEQITSADLPDYDLVFLGSACHSATLAPPVLGILSEIPAGSRIRMAGFATHSCKLPGGSERDRELYEKWASGCQRSFETAAEDTRLELLGYFGCQGAASPPIEDFIHSTILPDEDEWQAFIVDERKHPDEDDLEEAERFTTGVLARLDEHR